MTESWICRCGRGTLYDVLQVSPWCEPDVIQAAYRALARTRHPDVNRAPDAEEQMRRLNAAYQVLSDPARRARYDEELALEAARPLPGRGVARSADPPGPAPAASDLAANPTEAFVASARRAPSSNGRASGHSQAAIYASTGLDPRDDGPVLPRSALYVSVVLVTAIVVLVLWLVVDAIVDRPPPSFRGGRVGEERGVLSGPRSPWQLDLTGPSTEPGLSPSTERGNR